MRTSKTSLSLVLALGLASGVALPTWLTTPASAAENGKPEDIKKDKVPAAALATMEKVVPAGSKDIKYLKQKHEGKELYVVQYDPPGKGGKVKLHVLADGSVFGGAASNPGVDLSPLTAAPAPAAPAVVIPAMTPLTPPVVGPPPVFSSNPDVAKIQTDIYQRQTALDQVNFKVAQLDQQIAVASAKAATDPNQAGERDRLTVERGRQQDEATRQAVEIARQDQRMSEIEAKTNPQLAAAYAVSSNKEDLAATPGGGGVWANQTISAGEVPGPAYLTMNKYTKGTTGLVYGKMTHDAQTAYIVHYIGADNKRYFATVWPDGKVRSDPILSTVQPDAKALAAAGHPAAGAPAAGADAAAHAAAVAAAGVVTKDGTPGVKMVHISGTEVPAPATKTMEKNMKASKEEIFSKDTDAKGGVNYSVHYLGTDGKRYFLTVSPDGKVVKGPVLSVDQPMPTK